MTLIIGSYGPNSALIGGLAMLPEEARTMMQELTGKVLKVGRYDRYKRYSEHSYSITDTYLFGGDYGQVVAKLVKADYTMHNRQHAPFVPNWTPPLQG